MRSFIVIILLLVSNCIYCQTVNPVTGKVWMDTCLSGYYQWGKSSNQFQLVNNPSNFLSLNHDPCPVGWRLPTVDELYQEIQSWQILTNQDSLPLNWRYTGHKHYKNGKEYLTDRIGAYWSGESYSKRSAYYLYFYDNEVNIGVYFKAEGLSVRCIKQ